MDDSTNSNTSNPDKSTEDDHGDDLRLSDYEVVSAESEGGHVLYVVRPKPKSGPKTGDLLLWRARRWKNADRDRLRTMRDEAHRLAALSVPNVLRFRRVSFHSPSETLYTVTDHTSHMTLWSCIEKSKKDGTSFRENFVWNVLHSALSACEQLQSLNLSSWKVNFNTKRTFIDPSSKIYFDLLDPVIDIAKNEPKCDNLICNVGPVLSELCPKSTEYSDELKNIIEKLSHGTRKCNRMDCNILLYHPVVLSHLDDINEIFIVRNSKATSNDSAFESDESLKNDNTFKLDVSEHVLSPNLVALDLNLPGYVPKRKSNVGKWKSRLDLFKEPQEVSEDALSRVWLDRLKNLQRREEAIEFKEREFAKKKLFDEVRSTISNERNEGKASTADTTSVPSGITLQTVMSDRVLHRNELEFEPESKTIAMHCSRNPIMGRTRLQTLAKSSSRRSSSRPRGRKRTPLNYEDMDSSLSADTGDNSIIPTSSKLSAEILPRPPYLSTVNRRKVHFNNRTNPFAEYDSVSSTTFTFFDIENIDASYEVPLRTFAKTESLADRIAKFTYLDLERMTEEKRAAMKNNDDSNRLTNVSLKVSPLKRKNRKNKHPSPKLDRFSSSSHTNVYNTNSESSGISVTSFPCVGKIKDRRKSLPFLLGSMKTGKSTSIPRSVAESTPNCPSVGVTTRSKTVHKPPSSTNLSLPQNQTEKTNKFVKPKVDNKENFQTPSSKFVRDKKRMSILGFKTPFKLNF